IVQSMSLIGKASDSRIASETPSSKRNRGTGPMRKPPAPDLWKSLRERKKEKEPKRKKLRKGTLVETAAAEGNRIRWPSADILLDDFPRCLENPAGFSTVTTSAAATI